MMHMRIRQRYITVFWQDIALKFSEGQLLFSWVFCRRFTLEEHKFFHWMEFVARKAQILGRRWKKGRHNDLE